MKYLSLFIILFSINSFAADYKSAVRLKEGDVISADVFNDIMDRIELTLKPILISELVGTWSAKQYICSDGTYGESSYCNVTGSIGTTTSENLVFETRTDTVTISDNGNNTFNWTSSNFQLFYNANYGSAMKFTTGNLNHTCSITSAQIVGCLMDSQNSSGGNRVVAFMNVKRTSPSQIVFYWGPKEGGFKLNHLILDKQAIPPKPPTALTASLSSGTVSLSWTASEGGATSYTIKAKTTATGTYSDVTTGNTSTTYSDSLSSGTKWYRIFAVNSDGTSIGSNVVSVTAP